MSTPEPPEAVEREAAWLSTAGDGLPALLKKFSGPFDNIQAYYSRTPRTQQRSIYVTRADLADNRTGGQRVMLTHDLVLKVVWPMLSGTGSGETEQRALDAAVKLIIQRIRGPVGDKTHGGRFLSVAEHPRSVRVTFEDPEVTLPGDKVLRCTFSYSADDFEVNG